MVISPTMGDGVDGTAWRIAELINSSIPIVPVTRINNFQFNTNLLQYKEAAILDYSELNWDTDLEETGTHLFGKNTNDFHNFFPGNEWAKFDQWVAALNKCVYFKRELLKKDRKDNVFALDYPCWVDIPEPQTKEQFDSRPISLFNFWGRSNENRLRVHAEIWLEASKRGYSVCDNLFFINGFLNEEKSEKRITLWLPHYYRTQITELLKISELSKLSLAMPGAGLKTFRQSEVSSNSIMVMKNDGLAYAYEWSNFQNCIQFTNYGDEIKTINAFLDNQGVNLYSIYLAGVDTCRKYHISNYISNYIEKTINGAIN